MTPAQVRMARAALGISVEQLARESVVPEDAVLALEGGAGQPDAAAKLRATFEGAGVEFLGEDGVRFHERAPAAAGTVPLEDLSSANDE